MEGKNVGNMDWEEDRYRCSVQLQKKRRGEDSYKKLNKCKSGNEYIYLYIFSVRSKFKRETTEWNQKGKRVLEKCVKTT